MPQLEILLPIGLILIMTEVGMGLAPDDFLVLRGEKRALTVGLAAQMLVLPVLALAISAGFSLSAPMAIGVMLIAAAPGGVTSNLLTQLAGGQVALAVMLTLISTLASVLSLPLLVNGAAHLANGTMPDFSVPLAVVAKGILLTTVLPLLAGMGLRARWPRLTARLSRPFRRLAVGAFAMIVVITFALNADTFTRHGLDVGPALLALNGLAMTAAFALTKLVRLRPDQRIAVMFETGLQNAALAIVVAVNVLGQPLLAVPAVIYAVAMNLGAVAALLLVRASTRTHPALEASR